MSMMPCPVCHGICYGTCLGWDAPLVIPPVPEYILTPELLDLDMKLYDCEQRLEEALDAVSRAWWLMLGQTFCAVGYFE